ncbi:MAG: hypothetical protein QOG46_290 [Pseudonocardiales bacterium]|nr:hypothetical protein [Pseudonocardiales bacterium]
MNGCGSVVKLEDRRAHGLGERNTKLFIDLQRLVFLPRFRDHYRCSRFPYQSIDRDGRRYVDWSAKIETLGEARVVAELWAELTRCHQHTESHPPDNDAAAGKSSAVEQPRTDAA